MKTFAITTLLCIASLSALAANIDGKWISERQVGAADGKTYAHTTTLTLKNDAGVLTGTVVQTSAAPWMSESNGRSVDISDGKIDGRQVFLQADDGNQARTKDRYLRRVHRGRSVEGHDEVQRHWHNPALRCQTRELVPSESVSVKVLVERAFWPATSAFLPTFLCAAPQYWQSNRGPIRISCPYRKC